jgi:hypothetical protein
VLPIFEERHLGCVGLFCFDQSSNHAAMAGDGLIASNMNLNPGGSQPALRDGWFVDGGVKIVQKMQDDHGVPKGIMAVLKERNLWPGGRFLLQCKDGCTSTSCCAKTLLASQPDFLEQTSVIEEIVKKGGHMVAFYPKFHCETNFIERYWGACKRLARQRCDYTFASLRVQVPQILKEVPLGTIRAFHRKAWRYIDAYNKGLEGPLAEWAVKKYKSHRRLPPQSVEAFLAQKMEEEN